MFIRKLDALFYAPGDGDGDNAKDGNGSGAGGGEEGKKGGGEEGKDEKRYSATEFDQLRSAKDKELSDVRAELDQIRQQIQGDATLASINEEFDAIDPKAEDAPAKYRSLLTRIGQRLSNTEKGWADDQAYARDQAAAYRAAMLVQEHGGDFEAYKAELVKGKNVEAMDLIRDRLDLRLSREARSKEDNEGKQQRSSVDNGRGGAGQNDVVSEMNEIDPNTPEGLKKWNENRDRFLRQLTPSRR